MDKQQQGEKSNQTRKYLSGSQKRKLKKSKDEMIKKLPKITGFLKRHDERGKEGETSEKIDERESNTRTTDEIITCEALQEEVRRSTENVHHESEDGNRLVISQMETENSETLNEEIHYTNDIGLWPSIMTEAFREHWIQLGSKECQNKNSDFKNSAVQENDGTRHCTTTLFSRRHSLSGELLDLSWLCYSESQGKIYCFVCKLFSNAENALTKGYNKWKKAGEKIERHSNSQCHRDAVADFVIRSKIHSRLDSNILLDIEAKKKYWREVLRRLIDVITFLSERCHAFRGHNETIGSKHNGNYLGIIELISNYDSFLARHLEKYAGKGHGSTSYLSHSICDELINIMAKEVIGLIVEEIRGSRYFSISVDSTPDITHTDQLCMTFRYVLPSGPVERFLTFIPMRSHTGENIANMILKFLEEHHINVEHCRGQSYDNASNMSGKYKGVQQMIKNACEFAEYCPCFAHSLNLVGSCAVEVNDGASDFFSTVQELYKFFSASTHLWKKLEDKLESAASTVGKNLVVVKRLSDTRWSARYDAVHALFVGYDEYLQLLEDISIDNENRKEVQNEAKGLKSKLSSLESCIFLLLWHNILERFQETSLMLQKEGLDLNSAVILMKSLKEYVLGFREKFSVFEEEAKEKSGNSVYAKDDKRKRNRKLFFDEMEGYDDPSDELLSSAQEFRINNFLPIIDVLSSALSSRIEAYRGLSERFGFFSKLGTGDLSDLQLREAAKYLIQCYPKDLEARLETELVHFDCFLKELRKAEIVQQKKISEHEMFQLIIENSVTDLFSNVTIALKIYLCMFVTNCKGERSFSKLKLILNYLRNTMGRERLSSLAVLSIESNLMRKLDLNSVIETFASNKTRRKCF